ncbi:hypothetical protein ACELLULO517_07525 [Acidisoma cellulosilytica]|uniref:Uncharacterized protein n=1 Tax=Acidisoma cellulosilyticum TaxID=2802395 RepID=A0A964E2W8_9PROT|nr:hypothetical protein [Acidisoma cellulosilyticum]MCB8880080.1 hypothetical protein [Acidisoma cellulosilyticum]
MSETIERPDAGALVVAGQPVTAVTLFGNGGVESLLTRMETEVRGIKRDISTEKGRKAVRQLAHKVARSKTALDEMGKGLNETKRAEINKVDAERRVIRERCDALKEEVLSELTAWEAKEIVRIKGHEDALTAMSALATLLPAEPTPEQVRESLERLDLHEDGRDWAEFAQRANELHAEVGFKLTNLLAQAVAREEATAEAERLRLEAEEAARQEAARQQREREARIAAEAAEEARLAAERRAAEAAAAERQRVEQERKDAEDARREAEEAAQAEIDALEELNRIAAERAAEAERKAAALVEKAEADRIKGHKFALQSIRGVISDAVSPMNGSDMIKHISTIFEGMHELSRNWEEFSDEASQTIMSGRQDIARRLHIVEGADAERATKQKLAADAQAERDREKAVEAERARAAAVLKAEQDAAAARERDREHRGRINFQAASALVIKAGITEEQAKLIVTAIAKGEVANVRISY